MTRVILILAAIMLAACDERPQRQHDVSVNLTVSTDQRDRVCGRFGANAVACYVGGVIYIRESGLLPAGDYRAVIPHDLHIPHFANTQVWPWMKCGYDIARASGFDIEPNQAASLCHEAGHAVGMKH